MAQPTKAHHKNARNDLTAEYVRNAIDYDPKTGNFTRRKRSDRNKLWNGRYADKPAGFIDEDGYVYLSIDNRNYAGSRLAWLWMTGKWPEYEIDHRDADPSNNRWVNLRVATSQQNKRNEPRRSSNTSGYKGVCKHTNCDRWVAQIRDGITVRYIGLFRTPEEAHEAWKKAARELHGEFARFE